MLMLPTAIKSYLQDLINYHMKNIICIFFAWCFADNLHAVESSYHAGYNYLKANDNEAKNVMQEANSPELAKELLVGYLGSVNLSKNFTCVTTFEIKPEERVIVKTISVHGESNTISDELAAMMDTYIKSRMLGMTRALSAERAILTHKMPADAIRSNDVDMDAKMISEQLGLPLRLLHRADDLNYMPDKSKNEADYIVFDGDVAIFVRVNKELHFLTDCMPIDRRLLTNSGISKTFKASQNEIATQYDLAIKAMDRPPNPINAATIARERRLYWTVVRSFFKDYGVTLLGADQATDYRSVLSEK